MRFSSVVLLGLGAFGVFAAANPVAAPNALAAPNPMPAPNALAAADDDDHSDHDDDSKNNNKHNNNKKFYCKHDQGHLGCGDSKSDHCSKASGNSGSDCKSPRFFQCCKNFDHGKCNGRSDAHQCKSSSDHESCH